MGSFTPANILRWGVLGTGWVSHKFTEDLVLHRQEASAHHIIQAIGSSSIAKGKAFVSSVSLPDSSVDFNPRIYDDYGLVYADPNVDIVYIATPNTLHKQNCLDAIAAGKHVLCEKPMAVNAREAAVIIAAAREKKVFLMEAMWTRFFPLVKEVTRLLHQENAIGSVQRMFCDFGLDMKFEELPSHSRLKDPLLGAGALLDIGIYPLTLANCFLDGTVGDKDSSPEVVSSLVVRGGIDFSDVVVLKYTEKKAIAVLTATMGYKTEETFCRIEGSHGTIWIKGPAASVPRELVLRTQEREQVIRFDHPGMGYYFEADAVAEDIRNGRLEDHTMPLAETLRMLKIMDSIRKMGGVHYPQDV